MKHGAGVTLLPMLSGSCACVCARARQKACVCILGSCVGVYTGSSLPVCVCVHVWVQGKAVMIMTDSNNWPSWERRRIQPLHSARSQIAGFAWHCCSWKTAAAAAKRKVTVCNCFAFSLPLSPCVLLKFNYFLLGGGEGGGGSQENECQPPSSSGMVGMQVYKWMCA